MSAHGRWIASLLFTAIAVSTIGAQDWNQWRGPSRTGVATTFVAPAEWPAKPTKVWQATVGVGHSSPVVASARAFIHSRIGEEELVTAFDASSGKQLWQQRYEAPYKVNPAAEAHGKGPKSTPVVADGRLFTFGINGTLSAFDATTGKVLWRKQYAKEFDASAPDFGTAMSPVVDGKLLIVHVGGNTSGAVAALDVAGGQARWLWKGDGPAYASPIVAILGGTRQVVTQSRSHVIGIGLSTGDLLWRIPLTTAYAQNIVTPVVMGDTVIYSGIDVPLTAVGVGPPWPTRTLRHVWENRDASMYMSSPVLVDGYVYGFTHRNKGQFFSVDAKTGKTLWTSKGREAENAALVSAGDLLMATTTEGELVIMRRDPAKFGVVKRYTVAESPIWAHPAPFGCGVLIKDAETFSYWTF